MPAYDAWRRLVPVHHPLRDFEAGFCVSCPGNDGRTRRALAALAVTKAGKRLGPFYFELNRITEAMTGNAAHLIVLEELDIAGLDRIFGADYFQVACLNQLFEDQRAMLKLFNRCPDIGADTRVDHCFVVDVTAI
jgi:hypothetical protein